MIRLLKPSCFRKLNAALPPCSAASASAAGAAEQNTTGRPKMKPFGRRGADPRVGPRPRGLVRSGAALICPAAIAIAASYAHSGGFENASAASLSSVEVHAASADFDPLPRVAAELERPAAQAAAPTGAFDGDVCVLATLSMPPEALRRIAADAAKLRIPLVLRGLPMKKSAAHDHSAEAEAAPCRLDKAEAQRLLTPVIEAGASVEIDPKRFRRAFSSRSAAAAPALFIAAGGDVEVFPGEVRPRYALAWAAENAESASVRSAAAAVLANAGLASTAEEMRR